MMYKNIRLQKKSMQSVFVCIFCMPCTMLPHFDTLEALQSYAQAYKEDIKSENNNPDYPDFTNLYKKERGNFFTRIKNYFFPISHETFDAYDFKNILEDITRTREQKESSPHEYTITLSPQGTIIFWGSLYGSYHSFVRTLVELHNKKIINDSLEIIKDECYFVFLGDVINRSPYSLVTLTVILTLMKKNPDKVIYLKGQQERNGYWENFTIRLSLKTFSSDFLTAEDKAIPLSSSLKKFFSTLPDMLIVRRGPEDPDQAFYASYAMPEEETLRKNDCEVALIGSREYVAQSGLEFLGYSHGTAIWSLLSCPNPLIQEFYKFYFDSFVIFEMGEKVLKSIITVFNQDVRTKNGFVQKSFDVLYAIPIENKHDIEKIHAQKPFEIGSTMPLSGSAGILGRTLSHGINASMFSYNRTRATDLNFFIRNNIFDDQLIPRIARANVKKLHNEYKSDILLSPVGTPTLASYLPMAEKEDISIFFPMTGANISRNKLLKNIINLRGSYTDEVRSLIDYMTTEYRSKRFVFFYQNDAYGKDALAAAHAELTKRGITKWTDVPYLLDQTNFEEQVKKIKKTNPDAIGFFSNSAPAQELIEEIGTDFFIGVNLFGISFVESPSLRIFIQQQGIHFTFSSVVPDPKSSSLPILKEYHAAMDRLGIPYSTDSLEGYIATELFFDALAHVHPKLLCTNGSCSITKQDRYKIMEYLENIKNYNFKGINLTFDPHNRSFNLPIWIETEDGTWIEYDRKTGRPVKEKTTTTMA